jgi:hypothetical protein
VTLRAHLLVLVCTVVVGLSILRLVRLRQLRSKYALLWLAVAVAMAPIALVPGLLDRVSRAVGVYYAPTTFMLLGMAMLFLVVIHYSWELSRLEAKQRTLAEEIALLRAELEQERRDRTGAGRD